MNLSWKTPISIYQFLMSKADPRMDSWPLMSSPFPILTIIAAYVYFVKVLGPAWMKNRRPFQIDKLVKFYNILMVISNGFFFFYGGSRTYLSGKYNWICEPIDYSINDETKIIIRLGWWFFFLKIVELLDTIFFVLKKKFTHITVLHVIHHSAVAWGVWIGARFGPGGNNAFFPFINCFIHMVMYFYYFLAAMGPEVRKYLWWKKYLTIMQMVQFVVVFTHAMIPLFTSCNYHRGYAYAIMLHAIMFMGLFLNFYIHAYSKDKILSNGTCQVNGTIDNLHKTNGIVVNKKHQ
ncbi:very long chain fatty acid elongase AAEL008004-like [Centruroides vittatus]|uniref:very long chain fatty acid elongase AAEL008004-like n=1 Tax=Centruroides vittatus TaxID=120091 RepID=UPI00350ECE47